MLKNASRFFVWIIMGLVIVGLVGFGSVNFGGSVTAIGKVGDTEIEASTYFRELNAELNAWQAATGQQLTLAQAQIIGLDQQVLSRVIATTALENETARLGLSVGDETLARQVTDITAFQGIDGTFDRETYDFVLEQSGLTAAEFEATLRADVARTILAEAVTKNVAQPDIYVDTLYGWARETRDFLWATMSTAALEDPLPAPTAGDLTAYYDANPAAFTLPEIRQITYGWLKPEDVLKDIPMDEGELQALYEARIDEFVIPERRLVERLVFGTEDEAQAAADRIAAGDTSFDEEVAARGLNLADIDLGDVREIELGSAGAAVFGLATPGVTGVVMSDLGPALFRMNAVLAAQETSFEEARDTLAEDYAADAARRLVLTLASDIDEALAGGATLEELAQDGKLTLGSLDWHPVVQDGIAAYEPFRTAAAAATPDGFPEVIELGDGGLFALRLDAVEPPRLQPQADVADAVEAGWKAEARTAALIARAEELIPVFVSGVEAPSTVGLTEVLEDSIPRTGFIAGAPEDMVDTVFTMEEDSWKVLTSGDTVVLLRLDDINAPDQTTAEAVTVKSSFNDQIAQAMGIDLQEAFASSIENAAGVTLDQAVINAVHANFP